MAYHFQGKEEDYSDLIHSNELFRGPSFEAYMAQRFPPVDQTSLTTKPKRTESELRFLERFQDQNMKSSAENLKLASQSTIAMPRPIRTVPFIAYGSHFPEEQRLAIERAPTVVLNAQSNLALPKSTKPSYGSNLTPEQRVALERAPTVILPHPKSMMTRSQTLYRAPSTAIPQQPPMKQQSSTATLKDEIKKLRIIVDDL